MKSPRVVMLGVLLFIHLGATVVVGQSSSASFGLKAGYSSFRLESTVNGVVVGPHWRIPIGEFIVLEPATMVFYSGEDRIVGGDGIIRGALWYLFPEIQAQFHLPVGPVSPFVGVGAGAATQLDPGDIKFRAVLNGSVGIRTEINDRFGALGEVRVRRLSDFSEYRDSRPSDRTADWLIGFNWRLGQ